MTEYIAGIDIGGTTVKLALFSRQGGLSEKWEIKTRGFEEAGLIFSDIAKALKDKLSELGIELSQLKAVGGGVPGPVRENGYLKKCANLGLHDCFPERELSSLLGVPAKIVNDANCAALGEAYFGAAKGNENSAFITLGTGVGCGIIVRGKIVSGNRGVGGEIGHFVVNPDEKIPCKCGNRGCLEQYASATGITRTACELLKSSDEDSLLRKCPEISAKSVCDAAKQGDRVALRVLDVFGKYLGLALSHIVLTIDPDVISIGGGVSKAGDILIDTVSEYVEDYTHMAFGKQKIVIAKLGNDAGVYGGAVLAEQILKDSE